MYIRKICIQVKYLQQVNPREKKGLFTDVLQTYSELYNDESVRLHHFTSRN